MQTKTMPPFRKTVETFTAGAKALAQRYFVAHEVFVEEHGRIFSKHWMLVGHQSQIEKAGDYFISEVAPSSDAGVTGLGPESLIIIRDKDDKVRGFYNVCRHRGTRLKEDARGHASVIQCPYHAWTYGLDGRLIGAPHMDEVPGFDKANYPLHSVNVEVWEGFVFVNLKENPEPLGKWFAPLKGKFSHWNMSILQPAKRIEYD